MFVARPHTAPPSSITQSRGADDSPVTAVPFRVAAQRLQLRGPSRWSPSALLSLWSVRCGDGTKYLLAVRDCPDSPNRYLVWPPGVSARAVAGPISAPRRARRRYQPADKTERVVCARTCPSGLR